MMTPRERLLVALSVEDLHSFPWPDPHDPDLTDRLREEARRLSEGTDFTLEDDPATSLFERAWYLQGSRIA